MVIRIDFAPKFEKKGKYYICPDCNGEGLIEKIYCFPTTIDTSICSTCNGTGMLTKRQKEEIQLRLKRLKDKWDSIPNGTSVPILRVGE